MPSKQVRSVDSTGDVMEIDVSVYQKKLEKYYDSDGKLLQYPPKRPMRILALIRIAERLDPSRRYLEKEINEIIRDSIAFQDIELLRRELYQYKLVDRLRDGSAYWAEPDWKERYQEYTAKD